MGRVPATRSKRPFETRRSHGVGALCAQPPGPAVNAPLQIACAGFDAAPLLAGSSHGNFVSQLVAGHEALASADTDAALIAVRGPAELAALAAWPLLAALALQTAVVVVADEPEPAVVMQLLQAGVQDVLPSTEIDALRLGRALRHAIERKRLEAATRRAYATDLSTGLPHLPQLQEHMTHLLALREREPAPMALIALRVSGLAATEAALGVESANVLRRKAAVRLRSALRASDVVASIGDDAFAVLLAWIDSPQDGERVASKLAHALARPFSVAGREQGLAVSVGLASYPEHGKDADSLLRRALAQATQRASIGGGQTASAADRGPQAAANDG
jgi:diguanylate cyclase